MYAIRSYYDIGPETRIVQPPAAEHVELGEALRQHALSAGQIDQPPRRRGARLEAPRHIVCSGEHRGVELLQLCRARPCDRRQRMLSQRIVKTYCQVGLEILPEVSRQSYNFV